MFAKNEVSRLESNHCKNGSSEEGLELRYDRGGRENLREKASGRRCCPKDRKRYELVRSLKGFKFSLYILW